MTALTDLSSVGIMSLAVSIDIAVTYLVVRRLCKSGHLHNFRPSTLILFNVLIMLFCIILIRMDISMGTGVGLFAVLAMLRFRSQILRIEEMFYLLMLMSLAFVHAAFPNALNISELLLIDGILIGMTFFITREKSHICTMKVVIHDLDLIKPDNRILVTNLVEGQIGYKLKDLKVTNINMRDEKAQLTVEMDKSQIISLPKQSEEIVKKSNLLEVIKTESFNAERALA